MSSFITNRDIPIFVTIPVIFIASKKNSVQNGKMGAKNSVAKELNSFVGPMTLDNSCLTVIQC